MREAHTTTMDVEEQQRTAVYLPSLLSIRKAVSMDFEVAQLLIFRLVLSLSVSVCHLDAEESLCIVLKNIIHAHPNHLETKKCYPCL